MDDLRSDLKLFGLQIHPINISENIVQVTSFPIGIYHSWTLPENFVSLLSKFISCRIEYLSGKMLNSDYGIEYLK